MIKVLVPLDGSSAAEEALHHALLVAKTFPAEITLLRVIAASDSATHDPSDDVDLALWHHQAEAYLDGLLNKFPAERQAMRSAVVEGNPADSIVRFMNEMKPDLLVLTRYGRGDAQEFATGGTAQKIIFSANCSVLLMDPGKAVDPCNHYHRILVPVDDTKDSDCAVAVATMLADINGASLLLVYVTEEPHLPQALPTTPQTRELTNEILRLMRQEARRRLTEIVAKIPKIIPVETRILVSSDLPFAIESTARTYDSDLVLLHTTGSGSDAGRRYGPVNQSLIQYSHQPLFILQPRAGEGLASNFRSVHLDESRLEAG